jgi:hypothetical protein
MQVLRDIYLLLMAIVFQTVKGLAGIFFGSNFRNVFNKLIWVWMLK